MYIVDHNHIRFLVQASVALRGEEVSEQVARWAGQRLWDENVESVQDRYPATAREDLPGYIDYDYEHTVDETGDYRALPIATHDTFDAVQVLKACDCYEEQSCEHDGWATSRAREFIDALRSQVGRSLPGYGDAVWGAPEVESGMANEVGRERIHGPAAG